MLSDLLSGQYDDPVSVFAFNVTEKWARGVSAYVAAELQRRADLAYDDLSLSVVEFVENYPTRDRQLALRLV